MMPILSCECRQEYAMGGTALDRDDGKMLVMRFTRAFLAPSSPAEAKIRATREDCWRFFRGKWLRVRT
jgi:hypothetical protein